MNRRCAVCGKRYSELQPHLRKRWCRIPQTAYRIPAVRDSGHEAVVCDLKAVRSADIRDVDVLTQVSLQNGYAPVLRIVGERTDDFIEPDHLLDWLERNRRLAAGDLRLAAPPQE